MRKFLTLILLTLSFTTVTAFANQPSLEDNMEAAGDIFKAIGRSLNEASKNAENAQAAAQMSEYFKLSKEQMPPYLQEMPEAKRTEAFKEYQEMIQQVIDLSNQLAQAFADNDNALAATLYRNLKDLKQDGHDQFDP